MYFSKFNTFFSCYQLSSRSSAFSELEKYSGEKYPTCLKAILIASGFGTIASLRRIGKDDLRAIEECMKENRDLIEKFNCCNKEEYQNQQNFRFLPGHEAIILGIRDQIESMKQMKAAKAKEKKPISDGELKGQLLLNFQKYFLKNDVQLEDTILSDRNILNFERGRDGYSAKCNFSCPFCEKFMTVNFKEYWLSSNVTSHFKKHIFEQDDEIQEE